MNDQLQKALTELANKLGTSVQYLWGVLVSQAKINAIEDGIIWLVIIFGGIGLWRTHKKCFKREKTGEKNRYGEEELAESFYYKNEWSQYLMIVVCGVWLIFFIICFCNIGDLFNSIFNTQYWELKKL